MSVGLAEREAVTPGREERPVMIFHVPFPLDPSATSASGIRPVRMRRAFEAIGFRVLEVSGSHASRREQMRLLRRRIREGMRVDFVYSEAATTPTGLGEKITPATSLTRDIAFLRFCRRRGIPVGLFYRDVYWRFDEYAERVKQPYRGILRWRYRADLRGYRSAVDRLYLPSLRMAAFLPEANRDRAAALPPGTEMRDGAPDPTGSDRLELFYVGGVGSYYRMQEAVRGSEAAERARLTICTRESEWAAAREAYAEAIGESTRVVHRAGDGLDELYANADIGMLFVEPIAYRDFAAPMKLYEYLGRGKPVIATAGTLAAEFVEAEGTGWAVPYDAAALTALLDRLAEHPEEVAEKAERARRVREEHTWEARARQVAEELAGAAP